jgi:soluble lytic murein transglycosylase-like protein
MNEFGSWELAMTAYNAGEGKMRRAVRRYRTKNFWKIRRGRYSKKRAKTLRAQNYGACYYQQELKDHLVLKT